VPSLGLTNIFPSSENKITCIIKRHTTKTYASTEMTLQ
jgi:hypothetical protein